MIQLRKSCEIIDQDEVVRLRSVFETDNCVFLPKLLDTELLKFLLPQIEGERWIRRTHEGIGSDDILDDGIAARLLHFLANTPVFIGAVRDISGCEDVSIFRGHVYRLIPNSDHYDSWHSDITGRDNQRLVGMSINLGMREYKGGLFQLREEDSERMTFEIANTGWGDATLFRLSHRLKHRVTAVTGKEPRISFAGWFSADAKGYFASLLRQATHNT